ncbi:RdgB/HAM1 family non-canonical purine NTP pyrophosphatase [Nesterenkonia sp. HG001]|uniref:RdgB/HAM1 family non-canonical purine NTP pyrophosphatase n=1 Tax=Nesterenkonia sp. HG001 TaxID=2983207 RepID=UPI002AC731D3|nr:RdgB/HAM1 family non-canonical purine NTP pyrophosphatase [Nesterenkonia sp. HG001]MDZ5078611.1 RdgB/HAM1 family non-canonical purine NTP pyrophosphatase [Nesterenkonia sp. HG001]
MTSAARDAQIVLATRNAGKVREFRALLAGAPALGDLDLDVAVVDAATAGCAEVPETGVTFEENALLKAHAVAAETGLPAVADDSGLAVEVLGGAPGIFSARWAGAGATDARNLELLLEQLADIAPAHRGAAFVCAAALALPDGREVTRLGRLEGTLLTAPRGDGGFGYDPILQPVGETRSCAELTMEEKNAISHRGQAFAALRDEIVEALQGARER